MLIELVATLEIGRVLQVCTLECDRRTDVAQRRHQVEIGECYFHEFTNTPADAFTNAKIELFESKAKPDFELAEHEMRSGVGAQRQFRHSSSEVGQVQQKDAGLVWIYGDTLLLDGVGAGVLAFALACVSYLFVEQPTRRWRKLPEPAISPR